MPKSSRTPAVSDLLAGLKAGSRTLLSRAITLCESRREEDRGLANRLLTEILPLTGGAVRVGITGVPGAGKSTFIDALGTFLTGKGHSVAVLAIDPSSKRTGGSILGDKTRMARLASDPKAFIRPSPSSGQLGGVAARTREAILLCEAAGFDVILVETVGTGQSELMVADMVDVFTALMVPGTGDDLQGIKKGLLEIADIIAVNKADGAQTDAASTAANHLKNALHILTPAHSFWTPEVLTVSALKGEGIDRFWKKVLACRDACSAAGALEDRRNAQMRNWLEDLIAAELQARIGSISGAGAVRQEMEDAVTGGHLAPPLAAARYADFITANLTGTPKKT